MLRAAAPNRVGRTFVARNEIQHVIVTDRIRAGRIGERIDPNFGPDGWAVYRTGARPAVRLVSPFRCLCGGNPKPFVGSFFTRQRPEASLV